MAGFAAVKVEIAFDAGLRTPLADATWTDVSDYVDSDVEIQWGRSTELSQTGPATCSLVLDNSDGRFTAGNTGSPYSPNVKLDRMLRVTVTPNGGSPSVRFTGYVDSWPATWPGGSDSYAAAPITATSRMGRLALFNTLRSILVESALENGATDIYPLDEGAGAKAATSETGAGPHLGIMGTGKKLRFTGDHVTFAGGQFLGTSGAVIDLSTDFSLAVSFRWTVWQPDAAFFGPLQPTFWGRDAFAGTFNGQWHRAIMAWDSGAQTGDLFVGGELVSNTGFTAGSPTAYNARIGQRFSGSLADAARFDGVILDPTDAAQDYTAFLGGFGTTTDDVLVLLAGFAGIPVGEIVTDPGSVNMGGLDTSGASVLDALRWVESTEGGVLIDTRDGNLQLIGRRARYGTSPVVTLDMAEQQIGQEFSPTLDRPGLLNDVTGTNAASNVLGVDIEATSARVYDQDSIDSYGVAGASVEVNAEDPNEAHAAASWLVANHKEPTPRVPTLTFVPLLFDASDQDDLLSVFLGDRVALTNLPDQAPDSSLTLFVEGGTEVWGAVTGVIGWSVSPIGLEDSVFQIDVDDIDDLTKFIGY